MVFSYYILELFRQCGIFVLDFGTVPTVWYFLLDFGTVLTVWYLRIRFWNCSDSVVFSVRFWNYSDSVVFLVFHFIRRVRFDLFCPL
jgi:hypothetical protein